MFSNLLEQWWTLPFGITWSNGLEGGFIVALLVWSVAWKGLALWKSARTGSKAWFTVFLIVNSLGILELLYLYVFSKPKKAGTNSTGL